MELASMLAGEPFGDRPKSVCRVIAAFLRTYNDCIDDARRQDLYDFAAKSVGTRSSRSVQRERMAMCVRFAASHSGQKPKRRIGHLGRILYRPEALGQAAARSAAFGPPASHLAALGFVDDLIALDGSTAPVAAEIGSRRSRPRESSNAAIQ
jgi:hypothetical protein